VHPQQALHQAGQPFHFSQAAEVGKDAADIGKHSTEHLVLGNERSRDGNHNLYDTA